MRKSFRSQHDEPRSIRPCAARPRAVRRRAVRPRAARRRARCRHRRWIPQVQRPFPGEDPTAELASRYRPGQAGRSRRGERMRSTPRAMAEPARPSRRPLNRRIRPTQWRAGHPPQLRHGERHTPAREFGQQAVSRRHQPAPESPRRVPLQGRRRAGLPERCAPQASALRPPQSAGTRMLQPLHARPATPPRRGAAPSAHRRGAMNVRPRAPQHRLSPVKVMRPEQNACSALIPCQCVPGGGRHDSWPE